MTEKTRYRRKLFEEFVIFLFILIQEEIKKGYITVQGGHRVGISGTAVLQQGQIATVREISSLNIRVARQVYGAAKNFCPVSDKIFPKDC